MKKTLKLKALMAFALPLFAVLSSSCEQLSTETFRVVLPTTLESQNESYVIPRLADSEGNRYLLPLSAFVLKDGTTVNEDYLGIGNYTIDITFSSKSSSELRGVRKMQVNQTHEDTKTYHYFRAVVHEWGAYRYFTVEDSSPASIYHPGKYVLDVRNASTYKEGDLVFAGSLVNGIVQTKAIGAVLINELGEEFYVSFWQCGPVVP